MFCEPDSSKSLAALLAAATREGLPVTVLGGGTNVLVSDAGVRGLVVHPGKAFNYLRWIEDERPEDPHPVDARPEHEHPEDASPEHEHAEHPVDSRPENARREHEHPEYQRPEARLEAGAGARMISVAKEAVARGYAGIEFAAGIPGTVGGAVLMNAGAFGGEIGTAVEAIETVSLDGEIRELPHKELEFSYRKLALDSDLMVTWIRFRLLRSSVGRLQEVVARVQTKRRRNQPSGVPNAGSIFKNPPDEYAGRLIEHAGLKGRRIGGAQVSGEHANFIVNRGGAKATEVSALMGLIRGVVWKKCGIWLEPEVRLIGEWDDPETS